MKRLTSIISFTILLGSGIYFSQDIITLKSGDEVKAKVTEINGTEVKYKKSNNLDGPIYSVYKNEIFMVKYENGEKEVFNAESPKLTITSKPNESLKPSEDKFLRATNRKIYEGNRQLSVKEYEAKMRTNPVAYNQYQLAKSISLTGNLIAIPTTIVMLIPLFNKDITPKAKKSADIIGWSGIGVSVITNLIAQSKARKAIDIYNASEKVNASLNMNENGIGLALRF